jgi:hypothetical protein
MAPEPLLIAAIRYQRVFTNAVILWSNLAWRLARSRSKFIIGGILQARLDAQQQQRRNDKQQHDLEGLSASILGHENGP